IRVPEVDDFAALGGVEALDDQDRRTLQDLRRTPRIEYAEVRRLKMLSLTRAFEWFVDREWRRDSDRAGDLRAYVTRERWWLESYGLFRAVHADSGEQSWLTWPADLRGRDPTALEAARRRLWKDILFRQYLQWIAEAQWRAARDLAAPTLVFGDLPFAVDRDSADIWTAPDWFLLHASVGVPPDAFSGQGQNWGLPAYRWDALAAADYRWLRDRGRRAAALFDGSRIDHVVGFYRTYIIPDDGAAPSFVPADEDEQLALGERIMAIFRESLSQVVAEDLGTVPRFVRRSLTRLGLPGYRVLRWEREWEEEGQPFRDPAEYPALSLATSGTHDTETMAAWWDSAPAEDHESIARLSSVQAVLASRDRRPPGDDARVGDSWHPPSRFDETVRDLLLEALFASGSEYLILPIQDLFGWTDRINVPATVDEVNWTWRLPVAVDRLAESPDWRDRQATLKNWAEKYGR
ncbi:MAG: 4-alpha-glucanotransferase, partial [Acidobacteria bacterium]|nr:4-alpha-glucanotransferase [Acidobacteriota bacterium]